MAVLERAPTIRAARTLLAAVIVAMGFVAVTHAATAAVEPARSVAIPEARVATLPNGGALDWPASHFVVRWQGTETAVVETRWLIGDVWSPWTALEVNHDGSDEGAGKFDSTMLRADGATNIATRVASGVATDIKVVAIDAVNGPTHAYNSAAVDESSTTTTSGIKLGGATTTTAPPAKATQPPVISRAKWGADETIRRTDPSFAPITKLIVHHTVTANDDPDPPSTIRAIYAYHVQSNGWDDIGYNFLIDAQGRIYEGRYSRQYALNETPTGEDVNRQGAIGAHAENTNNGSVGIALLGTFSGQGPTSASVDALTALLAWKADRHDIDPNANDTYPGPNGTTRTFPNIAGHRDTKATECPGNFFYPRLPEIRNAVATRIGEAHVSTPGYWVTGRDARLYPFGTAQDYGSMSTYRLNAPIVGLAVTPTGKGYWQLGGDGGIFAFGDAGYFGSTGGLKLNKPLIRMAPTPTGKGYWLVASDGGIFAFGDAGFFGSTGGMRLNQPVVGMAATPTGRGYWLVASDGGIFSFGDARYHGSTGGLKLVQPVVSMAADPLNRGYWLVAKDGGLFAFDVPFYGSVPGLRLASYAGSVQMAATSTGRGYYIAGADGGIFAFGDARYLGAPGGLTGAGAASDLALGAGQVIVTRVRRSLTHFLAAACALALVIGGLAFVTTPQRARAYPTDTVELSGHGFGHGRGMGQWGSLGYALDGWSWQQILDRYYGGTTLGSGPAIANMRVRMLQNDGLDVIVTSQSPFTAAGTPFTANDAVRIRRTGSSTWTVERAPSCSGPWQPVQAGVSGQPEITPANNAPGDDRAHMLQLCLLEGIRWVRGSVRAIDENGAVRTVNILGVEEYLRGVVPRESPASWGDLGGGAGMNALRAQAVAARSYSITDVLANGGAGKYGYADTCNSELCQVYGGVALQQGSTFFQLEQARTNQAIAETAGMVRLNASKVPARTEFSSSTGGHSAGGTFPAVVDDGDDVCIPGSVCNTNHNWTVKIAVSSIESKYPQLGTLLGIEITSRNGFGAGGGRVTGMTLRGSLANVNQTGNQFRSAMGLKSDWFSITNSASGGLQGYWLVANDGGIFAFGNAPFHGSTGNIRLNQPIVGMGARPTGDGYWMVASDGGVFTFGGARFHGSTGNIVLNKPIVGIAPTPTGNGYWLVATDGGVFSFGDAGFHGSTGNIVLNKPIVGMATTPTGKGYWMVASDGGVFAFGDAKFFGSTGNLKLVQPVVGMATTPTGAGYWMVAADGGIFAFGDAGFFGSRPTLSNGAIAGIEPTRTGKGYIMVSQGGAVSSFGDAPYYGGIPQVVPGYKGRVLGIEGVPTAPN